MPTLQHQVKLKGAKYPNDIFVISLPAGGMHSSQPMKTSGDLHVAAAGISMIHNFAGP